MQLVTIVSVVFARKVSDFHISRTGGWANEQMGGIMPPCGNDRGQRERSSRLGISGQSRLELPLKTPEDKHRIWWITCVLGGLEHLEPQRGR